MDGIAGPLFVSIGDAEKLNIFLDANPEVTKESCFVDGYEFNAYKSMGLQNIGDDKSIKMEDVKLEAPDLGFSGWWKYMTSMMKISPIPKEGVKFGEVPEGVLRLGATFVFDGDEIIYEYRDKVPGDHPQPSDVLASISK